MRIARRVGSVLVLVLCLCGFRATTGTYTGDGIDDRTIAVAVSFPIHALLVKSETNTQPPQIALSAMEAGLSTRWGGSEAYLEDCIQVLGTGSFQVGTHARCNANAATYHYLALGQTAANDFAVGTYSGNGTDNRSITTSPAFQPDLVMVFANNTNAAARVWKVAALPGDSSCVFDTGQVCTTANQIQALESTGFQVGSGGQVNAVTITYTYLAIKTGAPGLAQGTYDGDDTDARPITTGWQPLFALTKRTSTVSSVFRFSSQVGDASFLFSGAPAANQMQAFSGTGFEIGTAAAVNSTSTPNTYYWFALRDDAPVSSVQRRRPVRMFQ